MNRTWVVGLVALLAGGGVVATAKAMSKSADRPRPLAVADPERARLEREVTALRREAVELRGAARSAQEQAARLGARNPVPPSLRLRLPDMNEIEQIRGENEAQVAALASRLGVEPRDPSWSRATEERLSEALRAQATPGTRLVSVECRTSLCGVTLRHDDPEGQRGVPHLLAPTLSYAAELVYAYSTEGPATTTVYISREGRGLATSPSPSSLD
jgi:hypothetical protein